MPIIDLLMKYFDRLKRDEYGTIEYDEQFKEITENLLNLENLDSTLYHIIVNLSTLLYEFACKFSCIRPI